MNRNCIIDLVSVAVDLLMLPLVIPAAVLLKFVRRVGLKRLSWCRAVLMQIGVLPLRRHYYEPFIGRKDLRTALDQERDLPGIDWAIAEQLSFLSTLVYEDELVHLFASRTGASGIQIDNQSFGAGDAEYLYQIIRRTRPEKIVEIGGGQSTLIARAAIARNGALHAGYECEHICIEPYEAPWLDSSGAKVIRQRVEDVGRELFRGLKQGDLLFIDSSHVIRPQGDVVTEYLEILPILRSGVIVHVHDVFSPRDYPDEWVFERLLLWDEQYLLEAFLTNNRQWKVLGALNLLKHRNFAALKRVCPYLTEDREPGSIYIQKQ